VHIAVLNANVDRSDFARGWPDDAHKVIEGLRPHRPGWTCRAWQACDGELPPPDDAADGWVITGSIASVGDEAPWMLALEDRIRQRHRQRQPTAGLCFGHQLVAKALGGRVGPSPAGWRLGVATTHLRPPLPAWLPSQQREFRLHAVHEEQVLSPPAGVRALGGDDHTPHAALCAGRHLFTTQYHPELSAPFMLALLDAFGPAWPDSMVAQARNQVAGGVDAEAFMGWLAAFFDHAAHPAPQEPA
jgi:GMP synthase-like glutamine amidotransferase